MSIWKCVFIDEFRKAPFFETLCRIKFCKHLKAIHATMQATNDTCENNYVHIDRTLVKSIMCIYVLNTHLSRECHQLAVVHVPS